MPDCGVMENPSGSGAHGAGLAARDVEIGDDIGDQAGRQVGIAIEVEGEGSASFHLAVEHVAGGGDQRRADVFLRAAKLRRGGSFSR